MNKNWKCKLCLSCSCKSILVPYKSLSEGKPRRLESVPRDIRPAQTWFATSKYRNAQTTLSLDRCRWLWSVPRDLCTKCANRWIIRGKILNCTVVWTFETNTPAKHCWIMEEIGDRKRLCFIYSMESHRFLQIKMLFNQRARWRYKNVNSGESFEKEFNPKSVSEWIWKRFRISFNANWLKIGPKRIDY